MATGLVVGIGAAADPVAATAWCPRSPGFWKQARKWPARVEDNGGCPGSVICNLAGESLTKDEVIAYLNTPPRGDKTVIMAFQLLAAKLNYLAGNPNQSACIKPTLDAANEWLLKAGGFGSGQHSWSVNGVDGEALKDRLDDYNNLRLPNCGCVSGGSS